MTRVNLIPAGLLTDQHLMAELHEIPRIGSIVVKRVLSGNILPKCDSSIPEQFVLGTGHVRFFYYRLGFIVNRIYLLVKQCKKRKIAITTDYDMIIKGWLAIIPDEHFGDYIPDLEAIRKSANRILERVADKPGWYKIKGRNLTNAMHKDYRKKLTKLWQC